MLAISGVDVKSSWVHGGTLLPAFVNYNVNFCPMCSRRCQDSIPTKRLSDDVFGQSIGEATGVSNWLVIDASRWSSLLATLVILENMVKVRFLH